MAKHSRILLCFAVINLSLCASAEENVLCVPPDDLVKADALLQIKYALPLKLGEIAESTHLNNDTGDASRANGMPSQDQTEERENQKEGFLQEEEARDASLEPAYRALAEAREDLGVAADKIAALSGGTQMMDQEALSDEEDSDTSPHRRKVNATFVQSSASEHKDHITAHDVADQEQQTNESSYIESWRSWLGSFFGFGGEDSYNVSASAESAEKQGPLGSLGGALNLEDLTTPPPPPAVAEEPEGPWIGATAPFSEKGFEAVTKMCCSFEAEVYLRRLVHQERLQVCHEGGLTGMLPYITCAENKTLAGTIADIKSFVGIKCAVFAPKSDHSSCTWPPECDANNTGEFNPEWHRRRRCSPPYR